VPKIPDVLTDGARADRIDHNGPRLVWQQVSDDLTELITSGALSSGDRLPSNEALSSCYSVSRITVRNAIRHLRKQGLLTAVQGRGTFVL
jgi:DNA-binding GntR family transcriptional regulator